MIVDQIIEIARAELIKRNAYCAVLSIDFGDGQPIYDENKIIYFSSSDSYQDWLDAMDAIFEPSERPSYIHTLYY